MGDSCSLKNYFIWDFWYHYDPDNNLFHVLYLNAPIEYKSSDNHHYVSRIGYATTVDFESFTWINNNVFSANLEGWDNTSIWTGDLVKLADGYLLYYTSRNKNVDDGLTQNIGLAFSADLIEWTRLPIKIMPDSRYYEEQTEVNDTSIHAWRDPFLFTLENSIYMLVSAKSRFSPLGKKGAIALLKARENSLIDWDILPPLYAPSVYSEMEVPQIYNERGSLLLCFSSLQKGDFNSKTNFEGGFHSIYLNELISTQENINTNVILPASSNVYACRIIPELGGCVVGFDLSRGGFVKTDCMVQASQLNRDFTMYSRANLGQ